MYNLYKPSPSPPQARNPVGSFWWTDIIKLYPDSERWQNAPLVEVIQFCSGKICRPPTLFRNASHNSFLFQRNQIASSKISWIIE